MGHFVYDEVDRIKLGDEDWVDIKRRMSYGDQQKLVAAYMQLQQQLKPGQVKNIPDVEVDLQTGNIMLLLINIKAWSLKDKDGKIAPVNEEYVRQLDISTANKIVEAINKRNSPPKA